MKNIKLARGCWEISSTGNSITINVSLNGTEIVSPRDHPEATIPAFLPDLSSGSPVSPDSSDDNNNDNIK